jgi:RNA polymerase sigma-70 factor (ECF subfamily)
MRDVTVTEIERVDAAASEAEVPLQLDEDAFRGFYDRTARPLWAYLARVSGDSQVADDLLQEVYYRFLRSQARHESEQHRRNYLFQIASNLVRDSHRRRAARPVAVAASSDVLDRHADPAATSRAEARVDLSRAMSKLRVRDRMLLWLAYAQGASHNEIAETLGLKSSSVKLLLFRARRRLGERLGRGRPNGKGDRRG